MLDTHLEIKKIYDNEESDHIFKELDKIPTRYRLEYKRFGKPAVVPRGQTAYTTDDTIYYNYGNIAGGSPNVSVMNDFLLKICNDVNKSLNTNFNTILLNKYKNGLDGIGLHKDNMNGWVKDTGFATIAFGNERDFHIKEDESNILTTVLHKRGEVIHFKHPLNLHFRHGIPKRKRINDCRISLTFREIFTKKKM
tara:strand:+ start:98 stop:682 length:585 start_codon:yes stop_codon:yes gene_type:complete